MMGSFLLPETVRDLLDGIDWFDSLRSGLGDEFENEFYAALERVKTNPESFAPDHTGYRACRLKRFTAVLYYRIDGDLIVVMGLFVNGRDETQLRNRG